MKEQDLMRHYKGSVVFICSIQTRNQHSLNRDVVAQSITLMSPSYRATAHMTVHSLQVLTHL
jgi:hypothetical protein